MNDTFELAVKNYENAINKARVIGVNKGIESKEFIDYQAFVIMCQKDLVIAGRKVKKADITPEQLELLKRAREFEGKNKTAVIVQKATIILLSLLGLGSIIGLSFLIKWLSKWSFQSSLQTTLLILCLFVLMGILTKNKR